MESEAFVARHWSRLQFSTFLAGFSGLCFLIHRWEGFNETDRKAPLGYRRGIHTRV
jgi:hypothetical protein